MATKGWSDLDIIEELRLRTWARENYVPLEQRDSSWHAVVLDEMRMKDDEPGQEFVSNPADVVARLRGESAEVHEEVRSPRILKA